MEQMLPGFELNLREGEDQAKTEVSLLIDRISIYMGEKKLTQEELKGYVCVSAVISEMVDRVYNRNRRRAHEPREGEREVG